uniref:Low-density lipoprotein receptor-related protein 6 n=1 Tax=Macrostomum lignano TaxID=282301 RepID=A0A1I8F6F4_9PLAT
LNKRQQLRSDLVAVIGQRSGLSIIINGRETGIPSLADQACHAVAYARNGPLKIFRLDASVGLPIEAADSDARASGSGRRVGGVAARDGGRAQAIIADHIIQVSLSCLTSKCLTLQKTLAVDDIGRKVYWVTSTDLRAGQVSTLNVDNYNGTDRRTLFRMPATHTILSHTLAVDSLHACLIFFVDVQTHSAALGVKQLHIHRLDGQEVYNVSHISEANSIVAVTVDAENAIIYWMESNSGDTPVQVRGFSYSTLLQPSPPRRHLRAQAPPSPFAVLDIAKIDRPSNTLAYQGGRLYWMRGLEIVACELGAGSGSATTAACRTALTRSNSRAGEILFHLVLLSKSDYRAWPAAFTDVCSVRKPCAHLCFRYSSTIADQRYTCLLPVSDYCQIPKNATHDYLLISLDMGTSSSVLKMSLDTQDYHPVQLFRHAQSSGLAMDPLANVIYWIDYLHERVARSVTETIRRLDLTRNQPGRIEKILENADEVPQDLAVDWSSGNLYWVTARKLIISKLDGRHQYVLSTFDKITAVKVDPIPGRWQPFARQPRCTRHSAVTLYWLSTSGDMSLGIVDRNGSNTRVVPISLRIPLSLAASRQPQPVPPARQRRLRAAVHPQAGPHPLASRQSSDLSLRLPVPLRRTVSSSTGGESAPAPEDGHSRCQALSTFLVLASARDIGMAPLNLAAGSASSPDYESLHLSNDLKFVEFVAADPSRGRICWADVGRHIACAGLDRAPAPTLRPAVAPGLGQQLLFYIDKWPWPRLCAVSLDRPSLTRTLLVSDRLSGARGLVFDSNVFRLFWIDIKYKDQGRIDWLGFVSVAAPMDVEIETGTVLTGLGDPDTWPRPGLERRLYFSDDKSVKSVTYEGVAHPALSVKPVGVAYHNSTVHFVALNSRRIHRVRVSPVTGEFVANRDEFGSGSVELPSGFRPISRPNAGNALKTRNFCLRNRCQHFCLLTRQLEIACACSDLHRRAPGDSGGFTEQCEPVSDWLHLVTDKGPHYWLPGGLASSQFEYFAPVEFSRKTLPRSSDSSPSLAAAPACLADHHPCRWLLLTDSIWRRPLRGFELKDSGSFAHTPPPSASPARLLAAHASSPGRRRRQCVRCLRCCATRRPDCHDTTTSPAAIDARPSRRSSPCPDRACLALASLVRRPRPQCSDALDQSEAFVLRICRHEILALLRRPLLREARRASRLGFAFVEAPIGPSWGAMPPQGMMSGHGVCRLPARLCAADWRRLVMLLPLLACCCTGTKPACGCHVPRWPRCAPCQPRHLAGARGLQSAPFCAR